MRSIRLIVLLAAASLAGVTFAQDAETPPAEPADTAAPAEVAVEDVVAPEDTETPVDEATADEPAEVESADEMTVEEEPSEPAKDAPSEEPEPADDADEAEAADDPEKTAAADENAAEAELEDEAAAATDWGGLIERAPAFFAVTHRAAVHLPIALFLFGGLFVLVGVVAPSWRTQVPLASLLLGTASAVGAVLSGWWNAHYEWGYEWAWGDGFGDFSEHIVQHRWTGVALLVAAVILSILALVSRAKKSKSLGAIWRIGLLLLAAAVAWEGHVGGEMTVGDGYLEDAFEAWVNPDGE